MSVEQLILKGNSTELQTKVVGDKILIRVDGWSTLLDRNKAHLLKLWLEEHLK